MKHEQKIVAAGALSGVVGMLVSVWLISIILPLPVISDTTADRLGYALLANVFALLPFFIMLVTVGNKRFLSDAIDPTKHAEDRAMEIDGRVAENTLQQNFVFLVATLALSTIVSISSLQVIWALAIVFIIARFVFWIGIVIILFLEHRVWRQRHT